MSSEINIICALILSLKCSSGLYLSKIVPEDISAGSAVVYGFAPKLKIGNDNRIGFGFKFGNHADFQILYEFGPQTSTSLQTVRSRSASYRQYQRKSRRRPFLEFLIRAGLLEVKPVENYAQNVIRNTNIKSRV